MFQKIIIYLIRSGVSELDIAGILNTSQSTVNRIKNGQVPRWDHGETLIRLEAETRTKVELALAEREKL